MPEEEGGLPRMAVLPPEKVTIEKTWNVHGMVATGSFDLVVEDAVVEWIYDKVKVEETTSTFSEVMNAASAA